MFKIRFIPEPQIPEKDRFFPFNQEMTFIPQQGTELNFSIPGNRGPWIVTKVDRSNPGCVLVTLDNSKRE